LIELAWWLDPDGTAAAPLAVAEPVTSFDVGRTASPKRKRRTAAQGGRLRPRTNEEKTLRGFQRELRMTHLPDASWTC
jgi:hypothetical protein